MVISPAKLDHTTSKMLTRQSNAVNHKSWSMMPYVEGRQESVVKAIADTKNQTARDTCPDLQTQHNDIGGIEHSFGKKRREEVR